MTNQRSPEATIMVAFKAFTVATLAVATTLLDRDTSDPAADASDPASQFIDNSVATPWYHVPHTFNEATFELELPSFTKVHESTPIELLDRKHVELTQKAVGDRRTSWQSSTGLPQLPGPIEQICRKCVCPDPGACSYPSYAELWKQFRHKRLVVSLKSQPRGRFQQHFLLGASGSRVHI